MLVALIEGRLIPARGDTPRPSRLSRHGRKTTAALFDRRGFVVSLLADGFKVSVLDESLGFGIVEALKRVEHRITFTEQELIDRGLGWEVPKFDSVPTGTLALVVTNVTRVRGSGGVHGESPMTTSAKWPDCPRGKQHPCWGCRPQSCTGRALRSLWPADRMYWRRCEGCDVESSAAGVADERLAAAAYRLAARSQCRHPGTEGDA